MATQTLFVHPSLSQLALSRWQTLYAFARNAARRLRARHLRWQQRQRALRELAEMDDRMLLDIGLSRSDVVRIAGLGNRASMAADAAALAGWAARHPQRPEWIK